MLSGIGTSTCLFGGCGCGCGGNLQKVGMFGSLRVGNLISGNLKGLGMFGKRRAGNLLLGRGICGDGGDG